MKQYFSSTPFITLSKLNLAVQRMNETSLQDVPWIGQDFRDLLTEAALQLKQATEDNDRIETAITETRVRFQQTTQDLIRTVRDFYAVHQRLAGRRGDAETMNKVFVRPSTMPTTREPAIWQQHARAIIAGEATAKAMNLPDPVNPSIADIAAALAASETVGLAWLETQTLQKAIKKTLHQKRTEGMRALRGLATRLRETLRDEPASVRRALMRTYGFKFTNAEDGLIEGPDDDTTPGSPTGNQSKPTDADPGKP